MTVGASAGKDEAQPQRSPLMAAGWCCRAWPAPQEAPLHADALQGTSGSELVMQQIPGPGTISFPAPTRPTGMKATLGLTRPLQLLIGVGGIQGIGNLNGCHRLDTAMQDTASHGARTCAGGATTSWVLAIMGSQSLVANTEAALRSGLAHTCTQSSSRSATKHQPTPRSRPLMCSVGSPSHRYSAASSSVSKRRQGP